MDDNINYLSKFVNLTNLPISMNIDKLLINFHEKSMIFM